MINKLKPYLMIAPAVALVLLTFVFGFFYSLNIITSCNITPLSLTNTSCPLELFNRLLSNPRVLSSIGFSLKISFISTTIGSVFGLILALLLYKIEQNKFSLSTGEPSKKEIMFSYDALLYKLPIMIPYSFVAVMVIDFLSSSGVFSKLLFKAGLISSANEFPMLLFDDLGVGIIVAYIYKCSPFVGMTLYAILLAIDPSELQIAQNLGASRLKLFQYIIWPKLKDQLLISYLIFFAFAFGSYEIPYLLGSSRMQALPLFTYNEYIKLASENRLNAVALNILTTLWGIFMLCIYLLTERQSVKRRPNLRQQGVDHVS